MIFVFATKLLREEYNEVIIHFLEMLNIISPSLEAFGTRPPEA